MFLVGNYTAIKTSTVLSSHFMRSCINQKKTVLSDQDKEDFLNNLKFKLNKKEMLNRPVNYKEVISAITEIQINKAPGADGLTSVFYKKFKDFLATPLLKMLSHSFNIGSLPETITDANISLILKENKPQAT